MNSMEIPPLNPALRALDVALKPIMMLLAGAISESPQETHFWHTIEIDPDLIDSSISCRIRGNDSSRHGNQILPFPLFHAPIFGGWKRYSILQVMNACDTWHIGWKIIESSKIDRKRCCLHRLPIRDKTIKMLTMPIGTDTLFFATNKHGMQIPVKEVAHGTLGDGKHPTIRLF